MGVAEHRGLMGGCPSSRNAATVPGPAGGTHQTQRANLGGQGRRRADLTAHRAHCTMEEEVGAWRRVATARR